MTVDDVPLGMRLKEQAGWNQTEADWQRLLALGSDGCFVAELDGRPVGTTVTCVFDSVAWIAMVLVDEPARHQGIATRLVQHALDHLDRRNVPTVRLDATPLGRPVYERLGFAAEYELTRLQGTGSSIAVEKSVAPVRSEEVEAVVDLDRSVTGTNRGRLLERLLDEQRDSVRIVRDGSTIRGFAMLRAGSRATQIGPAVALSPDAGRALLDWCLQQCDGQPVFIDVPIDNAPATQWATTNGLVVQRPFTRMCRGRPVHDDPIHLWASSGPEKG
jgi:GNAT superfamily N-acetyltransferase